jgi:hypothetical protein
MYCDAGQQNINTMKWEGHVARIVERRGVYKVLLGKPKHKLPGRNRRSCKANIWMNIKEVGCGGMDWIELAQD